MNVNTTPNVATPSFQARLKNNDVTTKVVNPKTKVGKTVLPDNNTNVQPAAEAKQKAKQEILDMMA